MATRLKTVHFAFPTLNTAITDNTLTSLTQITVYLPETGTKTFRSVIATLSVGQTETATGNITTRQLQCRLAAIAFVSNTNSNVWTGSGEDTHAFHQLDLTSHFTTNWSGTSMTFDAQVLIDSTATTPGSINASVTLSVTYEYDDTSTTQVKTVFIPLNAPVAALATSKPGAAVDTIPNLSTYLPETSKVYRSIHTVIQGNTAQAAGTTDMTITQQIDATTAHTTGIFEAAAASDVWVRYVWDCSAVLVTNATNGWYIWGNVAKMNHLQAYLVVTYEFDASASTDALVSMLIPATISTPMGGTTSSDYNRATTEVWVPETGVTHQKIAFYAFWDQAAAIAGLNMRVGTGSFVTYTDTAAAVCGSVGAMCRNDAAFTLVAGKNTLTFDIYRTDATDLGFAVGGFWIINYTADKPSQGYGAMNHTVIQNLKVLDSGAAASSGVISATSLPIPESDYFINGVGMCFSHISQSTGLESGYSVRVERLSAEGGVKWEDAQVDISWTDAETGLRLGWDDCSELFDRWPGDLDASRLNIETARRWDWTLATFNNLTVFAGLELFVNYHAVLYTVAGTVSAYADADGAGLTVELHKAANGELVKSMSTSAGGTFSFAWYDNTAQVYTVCFEDSTHQGVSDKGLAA